jgi:hypothetical protein
MQLFLTNAVFADVCRNGFRRHLVVGVTMGRVAVGGHPARTAQVRALSRVAGNVEPMQRDATVCEGCHSQATDRKKTAKK